MDFEQATSTYEHDFGNSLNPQSAVDRNTAYPLYGNKAREPFLVKRVNDEEAEQQPFTDHNQPESVNCVTATFSKEHQTKNLLKSDFKTLNSVNSDDDLPADKY